MAKNDTLVESLTEIMRKNNVIAQDQAKAIKKVFYDRSKPSFVDFLLEEGLVSRAAILNALSEHYNVPAFDVVGHFFDHNLLRKFPKGVLLRNTIIPLQVDVNMLIVIASEPDNPELLPKIGEHVSYNVRFLVGIEQDIIDAAREFYDLSPAQEVQSSTQEGQRDVDRRKKRLERKEAEEILLEEEED